MKSCSSNHGTTSYFYFLMFHLQEFFAIKISITIHNLYVYYMFYHILKLLNIQNIRQSNGKKHVINTNISVLLRLLRGLTFVAFMNECIIRIILLAIQNYREHFLQQFFLGFVELCNYPIDRCESGKYIVKTLVQRIIAAIEPLVPTDVIRRSKWVAKRHLSFPFRHFSRWRLQGSRITMINVNIFLW